MSTQPNEREAWAELYEAANQVIAAAGAHGQISARGDVMSRLVDALHVLDGGVYAANTAPAAPSAVQPAQAYAARYRADPADPSQAEQVATYTDGWDDAMAAQPVTPCHQSDATPTPCAGMSCGTTTAQHSRKCIAEHAAAVAGGRFVKVPAGMVIDAYAIVATEGPFANGVKVTRVRQIRSPDMWAVRHDGNCLNKSGEWEWEPMPSSRDDEFIARCRFASAEEAIAAALQGGASPTQGETHDD